MSLVFAKITGKEANSTISDRRERWNFIIQMSAATDTGIDAQLAMGVAMFEAHPSDPGMVATRIDAKYIKDSAYTFDGVVEFSTIAPSGGGTNPLDLPIQINGGGLESQRAFTKDAITGEAVVNTAFDSFDPQPTETIFDEQITVIINQASIDPSTFNAYRGAVNSDDFVLVYPDGVERDFDAGTCKMGDITYAWKSQNGVDYWEVAYPIAIRNIRDDDIASAGPEGVRPWKRQFLNEGYNEIAETEKVAIFMDDGKRASTPQLLDADGARITGDSPTPIFLRFNDYIELPFGTLDLS